MKQGHEQYKLDEAIFNAARSGDLNEVKQLRALGANINAKVRFQSVLSAAAESEDENTLRYVLDNGQNSDSDKFLILRKAARAGQLKTVTMLMTEYGIESKGAIHEAAFSGQVEVVEFMLQLDPTYLHSRCSSSKTILHTAVIEQKEDVVQLLLYKYKPNLDLVASSNNDVWTVAVMSMNINIIKALIEYKADVNKVISPSHSALRASCSFNRLAIAELLILAGADVNDSKGTCYDDGYTPLHILADSKLIKESDLIKMTSLLVEYGADPDELNYSWQSAEDIIRKNSPIERLQAFEAAVEAGSVALGANKAIVQKSLGCALPFIPESLTELILDYLEIVDINNKAKPFMLLSSSSDKSFMADQTTQDSLPNEESKTLMTQLPQDKARQMPAYLSSVREVITRDYVISSIGLAAVLTKHPLMWDKKDFKKMKLVIHPDKGGDAEDFKVIDAFEKEMLASIAEAKVPLALEPKTWETTIQKLTLCTKGVDLAIDLTKLYMQPSLQHTISLAYDAALLQDKLLNSNSKQFIAIAAPLYSLYQGDYVRAGLQALHGYSYYALKKGAAGFFGLSAMAIAYEFYEGHYVSGTLQILGMASLYLAPTIAPALAVLYTAQNAYAAYKIYEMQGDTVDSHSSILETATGTVTKAGEDALVCEP